MSRNKQLVSVLLAVLVTASVIGPVMVFAAQPVAATPSGYVGLAESNIDSPLPSGTPMGQTAQEINQAGVLTNKHAETLEVITTTPGRAKQYSDGAILGGGPIAIVLRDDVHDAGRTVALPKGPIEETLGYVPEMARGTHDDGSTWTTPIGERDGWLFVEIPHFSTNTVTFEGEVQHTGTFTDGSSISYPLNDLDAASDVTVNLTGKLSTEQLSQSYFLSDGESQSFTVGGNQATDLTLELTGESQTHVENNSTQYYVNHDQYDAITDETKSGVLYEATESAAYDVSLDWYLSVDTYNDDVDTYVYYQTYDASADTYSSWTEIAHKNNNHDTSGSWSGTFETTINLDAGDRVLGKSQVVYGGANPETDYGKARIGPSSYSFTKTSGSISGSVAGEAYSSPELSVGETWNTSVSGVAPGDHTLDVSSSTGGAVDANITGTERTQTTDPGVELNSENVSVSGTLADGETVTKTINSSALVEGTNTVNVSMPSLSADAPPMQVDLDITHTDQDDLSTEYEAEKFTERYEFSKTYASDRQKAQVTIPFQGNVVAMRDLVTEINGSSISPATSWDNHTLTIGLGSVLADETVHVTANATKVTVSNGAINVLEPTAVGSSLDSKIEVTSTSGDLQLGVGGLPTGHKIHYAHSPSYDTEDARATIDSDGSQMLTLPNAAAGSTVRVATVPIVASLQSGSANVSVLETGETPELKIEPGPNGAGDTVELAYLDTKSGTTYRVLAVDADGDRTLVDSDVASSPAYLEAPDDVGHIVITTATTAVDDGTGTGTDGPGTGTGATSAGGSFFVVIAIVLLTGVWFVSQRWGEERISTRLYLGLSAGVVLIFGTEIVSSTSVFGTVAGGIAQGFAGLAAAWPLAILAGSGIVVYYLYSNGKPSTVIQIAGKRLRK